MKPLLDIDLSAVRGNFILDARFCATAPITAIYGPSGAGKSTLLHLVAGLLSPTRGHVRRGDHTLFDKARGIDVRAERRGIGYVFQEPRLFPHLKVRANLLYGIGRRARSERARFDLDQVVQLLELQPLLSRWPLSLSGGEAQRVALARAVLTQPQLLLCDEPLNAVGEQLRRSILATFVRTFRTLNLPVVYVSHSLPELRELAQTCVVLQAGRVVAEDGRPATAIEAPRAPARPLALRPHARPPVRGAGPGRCLAS